MARYLFSGSQTHAEDVNGNPASGALMTFWLSDTTTLTPVYAGMTGGTTLTNPVEADSVGRFPNMYLDVDIDYRVKCTNADGSDIIFDLDPVREGVGTGYATYAVLADDGGADLIGTSQGDTVQDVLDGLFFGLFADFQADPPAIPIMALRVQTAGYYQLGKGAAWVIYDGTVSSFSNTTFVDSLGRGWSVDPYQELTPEMCGAKGDGTTNDTLALSALADLIDEAGGGVITFRPEATYLVGIQTLDGNESGSSYLWDPNKVLEFVDLPGSITLKGNGCTIKCRDGLKYGSFTSGGSVYNPSMPYFGDSIATPYKYMIRVEGCQGQVDISGFNLDGNIAAQNLGGQWGDTGRQIPCIGLYLADNVGEELISNVYSHHHGQDGAQLNGISPDFASLASGGSFTNVRCEHNGRQGISIVGGAGYTFTSCKFNYTGKDIGFYSAPGAGVDIEGEGGKDVHNLKFINCEFACNSGVGMVADQGSSRDVEFSYCRFIGDTNHALWPGNLMYRFYNCRIVGSVVSVAPNALPEKAVQFHDCDFSNDTTLSPTGAAYLGAAPIVDMGGLGSQNILFRKCTFRVTGTGRLPYSNDEGAIYDTCEMTEASSSGSYPRGLWRGISHISSPNCTYAGTLEGDVFVTGGATQVTRRQITVAVPTIAAGATELVGASSIPSGRGVLVVPVNPAAVNWLSISISWNDSAETLLCFTNRGGGSFTGGNHDFYVRTFSMAQSV